MASRSGPPSEDADFARLEPLARHLRAPSATTCCFFPEQQLLFHRFALGAAASSRSSRCSCSGKLRFQLQHSGSEGFHSRLLCIPRRLVPLSFFSFAGFATISLGLVGTTLSLDARLVAARPCHYDRDKRLLVKRLRCVVSVFHYSYLARSLPGFLRKRDADSDCPRRAHPSLSLSRVCLFLTVLLLSRVSVSV